MRKMLDLKTLSVLIVDDVKSMRSVVRSLLKNLKIGRTIHMAENGLEALKILYANPIDIAIVDWRMPVMNGAQLLEEIRGNKALRDLAVLMVTGESQKDIVLEAAEIEVEGYLLKPLTPALLEEKIKSVVKNINYPEKADLHVRKARFLEEKGQIDQAILHLEQAIRLRPGASRLLRNAGLLYQKLDDKEKMEEYLKAAISVNIHDVVSRRILGYYYWKKSKFDQALLLYHEVVEMTRKFSFEAIAFGRDLLEEDKFEKAKALFDAIIAQSPKNIALIEEIIDVCLIHDKWGYVLNLLEKLIRDFPSNYDLVYQAAGVCEKLNDFDKALEHYLVVEKHQFSRSDVKLKIARIYIHKNKVLQADTYLNMILKKDPKNKEALDLRRMI